METTAKEAAAITIAFSITTLLQLHPQRSPTLPTGARCLCLLSRSISSGAVKRSRSRHYVRLTPLIRCMAVSCSEEASAENDRSCPLTLTLTQTQR